MMTQVLVHDMMRPVNYSVSHDIQMRYQLGRTLEKREAIPPTHVLDESTRLVMQVKKKTEKGTESK